MKTAGIIAEYNPFHSGHNYHIEETRKETGADYVIVLMSGDYVQRGEPAIVDKYLRTKMALCGGADLVLELPTVYATASAEYFATAGVGIFSKLGCVDFLSFGSEWAGIEEFAPCVDLLLEEPDHYKEALKEALKEGKNYPAARQQALNRILGEDMARFLGEPNHILGLEYLKAIKRYGSDICPVIIKRKGAAYHEKKLDTAYPSATAIRRWLEPWKNKKSSLAEETLLRDAVEDFSWEEWKVVMGKNGENGQRFPESLAKELLQNIVLGDFVDWDDLMPYFDYLYLFQERKMEQYFGIDKDLAGRIQKRTAPGRTFEEMIAALHGKQMTDTALRRALLHGVLQIKKMSFLQKASEIPLPYVRVLGFRKTAAPLLKRMRKTAALAFIQKPSEGKNFFHDSQARYLYETDIRSANLYEQIAAGKSGRTPKNEYVRQQIIIE